MIPIDPASWVAERKYSEQDYDARLKQLLQKRDDSVAWLNTLTNPAWDNVYQHPQMGPLTAAMFLSNWLAHDYLHLRQIARMKFEYYAQLSGESMEYAGGW